MSSWWSTRRESKQGEPNETLIRVCVVSRDPALVEEVHKDLLVGFATRGGYDFEPNHPDFQRYGDVLFVDLRAAGIQAPQGAEAGTSPAADSAAAGAGTEEGLAFIDAIRKSVSHPPIVVLCDADAGEFARAVMRHGAYERLTVPLRISQLRLALQRAYEFRVAETRLESFLTEQTAAHEKSRKVTKRKSFSRRATVLVPPAAPGQVRVARKLRTTSGPSRLALGFLLGCVMFLAIIVGVRALLTGMSNALASAGFTSDSSASLAASAGSTPGRPVSRVRPLSAAADVGPADASPDSGQLSFRNETLAGPAGARGPVPGYEPAEIVERVTPRYSAEARAAHLQGTVRIRLVIGRDGVPHGLARVSGDAALAQIAMDAISLWRYAPATVDDNPVESELIIPIEFRLPD